MNVYNKTELKNLAINIEAKKALDNILISTEEFKNISNEFKTSFYIPKFAIKTGLFLLIFILSGVFFGLLTLMFYGSFQGLAFISIFMFLITLICTYFFSVKKLQFGSGADTAFLYCSIIFFMIWCSVVFELTSGQGSSFILFIISLAGAVLFIDRFLIIIASVSFFAFIYFSLIKLFYLDIVMLSIIAVSFLLIYFSNKYLSEVSYWNCKLLKTLMYTSLTTLFIASNTYYFKMITDSKIIFSFAFNILTIIVPLIYVLAGLKYKNIIFLRVGAVLFPAAVFSFIIRYATNYFFEYLFLCSAVLIAFLWWLTRYLSKEKAGFIFIEKSNFSNLEALGAINTATSPPTSGFEFGGGSFGGGGASGDF